MASLSPVFDLLYFVPDLPVLLFLEFDPSTLALAACVCVKWRDLARRVRESGSKAFQLSFRALVHNPIALAWAVDNLNVKQLPIKLRDRACIIAAQEGALEALKWLRANDYPWSRMTCAMAARGGHLDVLRWAHENGCNWNAWTCAYAAKGGHLKILQWARENGCFWDEQTCAEAAKGGHLGVLQWAHAQGCPWNNRTCANAAEGGHLEMLQWARENGCSWFKKSCLRGANNGGHVMVAAWIETQFDQQS